MFHFLLVEDRSKVKNYLKLGQSLFQVGVKIDISKLGKVYSKVEFLFQSGALYRVISSMFALLCTLFHIKTNKFDLFFIQHV